MKFDQDLCATCDMNSTLGSVVPLAMFCLPLGMAAICAVLDTLVPGDKVKKNSFFLFLFPI